MSIRTILLVIAVSSAVKPAAGQTQAVQPLPDSIIVAAIQSGLASKESKSFDTGEAEHGFAGSMMRRGIPVRYEIYLQGPEARIASLAALNARKYLPFTIDSLPASAKYPFFSVRVVPGIPRMIGGTFYQAAPIEHVILQGRGTDSTGAPYAIIQPIALERSSVSWSNLAGGKFSGESVIALFDARLIPHADLDVVVVNAEKEFRIRVKRDEVDSVR